MRSAMPGANELLSPEILVQIHKVLKGWCQRPGAARIGFGEVTGTVLAA